MLSIPTMIFIAVIFVVVFPRLLALSWLAITHTWFRLWLPRERKNEVPGGWELAGYWWRESSALVSIARNRLIPMPSGLRELEPDAAPILLLHGYTQNATNWHPLRRHLQKTISKPIVTANLGLPGRPLEKYAARVIQVLEKIDAATQGGQLHIVAHSLGGVALRVALDARPDLRENVHQVITLGSPHQGTAATRFLAPGADAKQLREDSEILSRLPTLPNLLPHASCDCIAARLDYIVYPRESSLEDGARSYIFNGIGHGGLMTDPDAHEVVVEFIREQL